MVGKSSNREWHWKNKYQSENWNGYQNWAPIIKLITKMSAERDTKPWKGDFRSSQNLLKLLKRHPSYIGCTNSESIQTFYDRGRAGNITIRKRCKHQTLGDYAPGVYRTYLYKTSSKVDTQISTTAAIEVATIMGKSVVTKMDTKAISTETGTHKWASKELTKTDTNAEYPHPFPPLLSIFKQSNTATSGSRTSLHPFLVSLPCWDPIKSLNSALAPAKNCSPRKGGGEKIRANRIKYRIKEVTKKRISKDEERSKAQN